MADPIAATVTQLRNIQARTGMTIAQLHAAVATSGAGKHGEKRGWLMERFKLGYGDANTVVHFIDKPLPDLGGCGAAPAAAPVPPPPHQFVPGGPLGEAGQTVQGPRQASDEEVRAMPAESSRHQSTPPGRVDLNRLLTQISQATNFRQKQRLVDHYHHAALLLPEAERDQAFQRLRALETPGTMTK